MKNKMEIYTKASHDFAIKQMIERFCFEMEICEEIFGTKKFTLETLKNDCRSDEVFCDEEYEKIYRESIELKKRHSLKKNAK